MAHLQIFQRKLPSDGLYKINFSVNLPDPLSNYLEY